MATCVYILQACVTDHVRSVLAVWPPCTIFAHAVSLVTLFGSVENRIRFISLVEQNSFLTNPEKNRYKGLRCVLDSLDDRDYCAKMTPCSTLGNLRY